MTVRSNKNNFWKIPEIFERFQKSLGDFFIEYINQPQKAIFKANVSKQNQSILSDICENFQKFINFKKILKNFKKGIDKSKDMW